MQLISKDCQNEAKEAAPFPGQSRVSCQICPLTLACPIHPPRPRTDPPSLRVLAAGPLISRYPLRHHPSDPQPLTGRPRPRPRRRRGETSPPHPAEPPRPSGRVSPCPQRPPQPVAVPLRLDQHDRGAPGEHGGASTTAPLKVSAPAARLRRPAGIRFQGAAAISGGGGIGTRSGAGSGAEGSGRDRHHGQVGFPQPQGHRQPHQVQGAAEAALVLPDVPEAVPR